jgi:DNA repair exonuclease SbcCD nuclease subunit
MVMQDVTENKSLTFIHASDIHLGSQQYRNNHRADDFIRAFQEILKLGFFKNVDFIILAGDVFTSLEMLPGKLTKIVNILHNFNSKTKGTIPIIAIEGNHDIRKSSRGQRFAKRGQSWLKLLSSLNLLLLLDADLDAPPNEMFKEYNKETNRGGKVKIKNAIIYGTRYISQTPEEYILKLKNAIKREDGFFHILLQHFGIQGQMENVPGVKYHRILPLKESVDYLALGHFHLQFTLGGWIYNPGSSEAACSEDSSYKRGIFLVEVLGEGPFTKRLQSIRLNNRKHIWDTISFPKQLKNKDEVNNFILQRLKISLNQLKTDLKPIDPQMPILYLVLKGLKPSKLPKINIKTLTNLICENFPVVDVRIYQKFSESNKTIDNYF